MISISSVIPRRKMVDLIKHRSVVWFGEHEVNCLDHHYALSKSWHVRASSLPREAYTSLIFGDRADRHSITSTTLRFILT